MTKEKEVTKTLVLKDGSIQDEPLVVVTMMSLERLIEENPIPFYELVMRCRDRGHQFFSKSGEVLEGLGLTERGQVHSSIAAIVHNAVVGGGLKMRLLSPIKESPNAKR